MRLTPRPERALLALDTEVAAGWWWYDGKTTHRLMIFVGQWFNADGSTPLPPFGWILMPDVIMNGLTRTASRAYAGLPLRHRRAGLIAISHTIKDADVLVGHNLTGFDLGTINGELMLQNLPLLPARETIDTLNDGPRGVFQQRSLGTRLSRLEGTVDKPKVEPVVWEAAFNDFDPDALREVYSRAVVDVQGHIDLFVNDSERSYV